MREESLIVSEQFYSIQGEGHTTGVPAYFLRLAGCNLLCKSSSWICDSIEVWRKGLSKTFDQVISDFGEEFIKNISSKRAHLVITGGEPLIHQDSVTEFLVYLTKKVGFRIAVEIETNGTISPNNYLKDLVSYWNVSPKLESSGESILKRYNRESLKDFIEINNQYFGRVMFKFVVSNEQDVFEIQKYFVKDLSVYENQIWLMPAADNRNDLQKASETVVGLCKKYAYKYSHRLHLTVWDKKTGV